MDLKVGRIALQVFNEIPQLFLNLEGAPKYISQQHYKTQQK
jgi:hypothetical protein